MQVVQQVVGVLPGRVEANDEVNRPVSPSDVVEALS
jgi:hypothetical protein